MPSLEELAGYLDDYLKIAEVKDDSLNGLQVANSGTVHKAGLAVDASLKTFQKCRQENVDFLFVHHGLFWGKPVSLKGAFYKRIRELIEADIALYAAHLPLDMHPEVGNNAQIQKILDWPVRGDFGEYHGIVIGKWVEFPKKKPLRILRDQIREKMGCEPLVWDFGPPEIRRLGYISGGGLSMIEQAIDRKFDAFITGEPGHSAYWLAKEANINVIFAGHYCTETLGVKAIGRVLNEKWGLETVFLDLPTGH
jgi:dinuclear metal center YbgI/SA1388 family protein